MPSPLFSIHEPLGAGTTAIGASAGTGKTYTLEGLVVSLLATEVTTDALLVVTYTRSATAELRARIRQRLTATIDSLTADDPSTDPIVAQLRSNPGRDVALARLRVARSSYDEITIATIHSFAQQMLAGMGSAAGVDLDLSFAPQSAVQRSEAIADAIAAEYLAGHPLSDEPTFAESRKAVTKIAGAANGAPDLVLRPGLAEHGDDPDAEMPIPGQPGPWDLEHARQWVRIAHAANERLRDQRARTGVRDYADLLVDLRHALRARREAGAPPLDHRFRVGLIDEFQDTDPIQWEIFQELFIGNDSRRLVIVGDPKQAIYRFRGADLHTYQAAVDTADTARRLGTNWRSGERVVNGVNALFDGVTFGSDVEFEPVVAAKDDARHAVLTAVGAALPGLEIRLLIDGDGDDAAPKVADDLVARLLDLHASATIPRGDDPDDRRAVDWGDIVVLTRSRHQGADVKGALDAAGIPAAIVAGESVLESDAASQWRLLLAAVESPTSMRRLRTAALGVFGVIDDRGAFTHIDDRVREATQRAMESFQRRVAVWADTLSRRGTPAFVQSVLRDSSARVRVFAFSDPQRLLTDLAHVGELLTSSGHTDPRVLAGELAGDDRDDPVERDDPRARHVATDDPVVRIMTMHASKGLEFPIVFCIGLHRSTPPGIDGYKYRDGGLRVQDVQLGRLQEIFRARSSKADDVTASLAAHLTDKYRDATDAVWHETAEDELRLAYVALTRAKYHVSAWWSPSSASQARAAGRGALTKLLFARDADGAIDPELFTPSIAGDSSEGTPMVLPVEGPGPSGRAEASRLLDPLVDASGGAFDYGFPARVPPGVWTRPDPNDTAPHAPVIVLDDLDASRGRWSFSSITAGSPHAVGAETRDEERVARQTSDDAADAGRTVIGGFDEPDDEPEDTSEETEPVAEEAGVSRLAGFAGGTEFGNFVHKVFEDTDFTLESSALHDALRATITATSAGATPGMLRWRAASRPTSPDLADTLASGIEDALSTPLAFLGGRPLSTLSRADRLDELHFEFHLPNTLHVDGSWGRVHEPPVMIGEVAKVILEHLEVNDPYRHWAESLVDKLGRSRSLSGYLVGSIDLVARHVDDDGTPRFVVVDYKTNRLHGRDESPRDAYGPAALGQAMEHHDYPLQALLYSVALHRYLHARLGTSYDPATHLDGVAYLFVRGMAGPDTPRHDGEAAGVARWLVPPTLIEALSDLFARSSAEETP